MSFRGRMYKRKQLQNTTGRSSESAIRFNERSVLLAIGYNINKLHHKIQAGRTGLHLFLQKQAPDLDSSKQNPEREPFSTKGLLKFAIFLKRYNIKGIFRKKRAKRSCRIYDFLIIDATASSRYCIRFYCALIVSMIDIFWIV